MSKKIMMLGMWLLLAGTVGAQTQTAFWMGNSFSMGLPELLQNMWTHANPTYDLNVREEFYAGTSLQKHWQTYDCYDSIQGSHYNYIIMQTYYWADYSHDVFSASDSVYATMIAALARANGEEPILDVTHLGYAAPLQHWTDMCAAYDTLAKRLNVRVIPRAWAWRRALDQNPKLFLWAAKDSVHPGPYGELLNAYVFYGFFTGQSPVGIPYLNGISSDTATLLQNVAWTILKERNNTVPVVQAFIPSVLAGSQEAFYSTCVPHSTSQSGIHHYYQLNGMSVLNNGNRPVPGSVMIDKRYTSR